VNGFVTITSWVAWPHTTVTSGQQEKNKKIY